MIFLTLARTSFVACDMSADDAGFDVDVDARLGMLLYYGVR